MIENAYVMCVKVVCGSHTNELRGVTFKPYKLQSTTAPTILN